MGERFRVLVQQKGIAGEAKLTGVAGIGWL
jgi:hypothetical protein